MARSRRAHGGSVRRLASGRWQVRVHDKATGDHVAVGTFATKADAVLALTQAVADQSRGGWVPPERGRVTLEVVPSLVGVEVAVPRLSPAVW